LLESSIGAAVQAFLTAFPALFSIVNPLSGAFIFNEVISDRPPEVRARLPRVVARNSLVVMLLALSAGSYLLAFFGVSLAALRCGGGLVLALSAWERLDRPEARETRKQEQVAGASDRADDVALFPLTIPFTTGPGTIAVSIALGAQHPRVWQGLIGFFAGCACAAVAMAATIWACYSAADRVARWLGPSGSRTITRLGAFLLLCIGVQILITGVQDVLGPLLSKS
jgi:multiple antibiotic resistance protein